MKNNNIIRHIQLKASKRGGKTSRQNINNRLATKPSGCIVWIVFDENTLELCSFYFFGATAGKPLAGLENAKIAKHTKGNGGNWPTKNGSSNSSGSKRGNAKPK